MSFPPIMSPTLEQDCFSPSCLGSAINNKIDALVEESGMESFQKLAEPYRSQPKLIKSVDFTIEDDLYVFSKWYLIKQGECCRNGCKNCPY
jgi:protein associated with RNAse G/E